MSPEPAAYWPWWMGALALAGVTFGFWIATRRPLGISGFYARLLAWRASREHDRLAADEAALEVALLEATRKRFGELALDASGLEADRPDPELARMTAPVDPLPVTQSAVLVVGLLLGALVATALQGPLVVHADLGAEFARLVGDGWVGAMALLIGGGLVGFGTRMAGGCTSGHGLNGCSRLQPASLVATASFFGAGVLVSLLLEVLVS